jgi:hypothetical protein
VEDFDCSERVCSLVVKGAPIALVLSVVGDIPVDSEEPVVTLSILRIFQPSLRRCS